ncbi:MAG: hypothetical protein ACT4ON_08070 [Bacteroidota bacterium]
MEHAKQELSLLVDKINSSFPEGNDLKGFLGISKNIIIDLLNESATLLVKLTEHNNHFESIFLKRDLSKVISKVIKDLDGDFEKIKPSQFDSILDNVFKIRSSIRNTYLAIVQNQPIRTEAEIIKAKEELNLLTANIESLKKINDDLNTIKESTIQTISEYQNEVKTLKESAITDITATQDDIKSLKDTTVQNITITADAVSEMKTSAATIIVEFEGKQKNSIENEQKVNDFLSKIEVHRQAIETIDKNTTLWEKEIKDAKEQITTRSSEYETLTAKFRSLETEIETAHEKIFGKKDVDGKVIAKGYLQETEDLKNKISSFLEDQDKKFQAQFTQVESLLPGATSAGLAKAFEDQRKSYKWPLIIWSIVFIAVTTIMAGCATYIFYRQFISDKVVEETLTHGIIALLKDLPFFIPTIWLAVFASKQQSQYKRLQQEYVFKEINAKSFYGHKKQIEELMKNGVEDNDLLLKLVTQLIVITSKNPSDTLDNKAHNDSPPLFKLVEKMFPKKSKQEETKPE